MQQEGKEREAANIHAMHNINTSPTCIAKAQAVIHVGLNISTTYIYGTGTGKCTVVLVGKNGWVEFAATLNSSFILMKISC